VVPFVSAAVQYGFAVFEGIRCYATDKGSAVFRMHEHVERLLDSAHIVGFRELPVTAEQVQTAINQTIAGQRVFVVLHPPHDLSGWRHEPDRRGGRAAFRGWRYGSGRRFSERRRRNAHPRQYCFLHAAASEHHDDQGQGLGKLCQLNSGQD